MLGRRAFARGSSLWSRSFNNDLPRRMAPMMVSMGSYKLAGLCSELPLHGFAEQYVIISGFGLASEETRGEISEDANEKSSAVKEVIECLATMRSINILRNLLANCTFFGKL